MRYLVIGAMLAGIVLDVPVHAKKPAASDEAAIRGIIERIYAPYSQPIPELPDDEDARPDNDPGSTMDGYEPPYTKSLDQMVAKWGGLMQQSEELYRLNSFDWFCQCQDNDNATSKLVKQSYTLAGKDRITANILFSPGAYEGKTTGSPLTFNFRREDGEWKVDDMKFHDFTTLRKGLAADIHDATKDMAERKRN